MSSSATESLEALLYYLPSVPASLPPEFIKRSCPLKNGNALSLSVYSCGVGGST